VTADARRWAFAGGVLGAVLAPLLLALTDVHLAAAPALLVISTATGALAVSALAIQPLLARPRRVRIHQALGAVILTLVLVHVGALLILEPDDALFALSPDGPTRARMALMATIALVAVVALGALRRRLPLAPDTWRIVHGFLAGLVIVLGVGHAVLTDGALDDAGTAVLLVLGAVGLVAAVVRVVVTARG
jgi:3-phenylpropionate/trans-cinnamate dioxygenase ferredoxin reductase subunit